MLLCTAYLTGTLIALGLPANPEKVEPWKEIRFCPLIDAPWVVVSLPEVQAGFDGLAASVTQRVQAALVSAAACPDAENCVSNVMPAEPK